LATPYPTNDHFQKLRAGGGDFGSSVVRSPAIADIVKNVKIAISVKNLP
jgi:hypothetical protein